jgi:hypothetical protein
MAGTTQKPPKGNQALWRPYTGNFLKSLNMTLSLSQKTVSIISAMRV